MLSAMAKPVFLFAYVCFGIFLVSMAAGVRPPLVPVPRRSIGMLAAVVTGLSLLTLLRFSLLAFWFPLCVMCGTALFALRDGAWKSWKSPVLPLAAITVVTCSVSLAWWLDLEKQPQGWWRMPVFALVVWSVQAGLSRREEHPAGSSVSVLPLVFGIGGLLL